MLLRRVAHHIKDQNWFAVAIDFAIVVLGVFIGIQVSNWNTDRANRALAEDYLARLVVDIEIEAQLWDKAQDYFGVARKYGESALADFDRPVDDLDINFLIALYQASQVWFVAPNRATFDELQSTGRIVFIEDPALRTTLSQHYLRSAQTGVTMNRTSQYRRIARLYLHPDIQSAIRTNCGDQWVTDENNFYYVDLPSSCEIDAPETLVKEQLIALHANEEVERELRFHLSVLDAYIGVMGNTQETAQSTIKRLREVSP